MLSLICVKLKTGVMHTTKHEIRRWQHVHCS